MKKSDILVKNTKTMKFYSSNKRKHRPGRARKDYKIKNSRGGIRL